MSTGATWSEVWEFIQRHGTPKLRAARWDETRAYLERVATVHRGVIFLPRRALLVGWPVCPHALDEIQVARVYLANVMAVDTAALRELMAAGFARWPEVQYYAAHRVPAAVRQRQPGLMGRARLYSRDDLLRLARWSRRVWTSKERDEVVML